MFKPTSAKDRINYGEVLMPPVGYKLGRAIGTTYSLDLDTLAAVSISLGLIEGTDSVLISNPISMLNALQKTSDRIIVFCEAGQIKLPSNKNALCLTLEKMVVPVSIPYNKTLKRYPAFHPKTWLLEYINENGEKKYRFVVMSRNMTFDHSWDVACTLDGDTISEGEVSAEPIIDFLCFLQKQLNKEAINYERQYSDLSYMIKTISKVNFHVEKGFSECEIMPMGIGVGSYDMASNWLLTDSFHELVVMSPFLTGSIIESLNDSRKTLNGTVRTLITRRSELHKIADGKASNFNVYVMKDEIIDGESSISDEEYEQSDQESGKQDIHAKIYIRRKYSTTDLYLGSMNASYAAINSNVEMMLRLRTKNSVLNGEKFLDDIMGVEREGKKNPFERVIPENIDGAENISLQDRVEQKIKEICRIKMSAIVECNNDKYDLHIVTNINDIIDGVVLRPLRSNKESVLMPEMEFNSLDMLQLSEFYIISVTIEDCTLERVIMIPTLGIPEGREVEIYKTIIKKRSHFIEYISFVLGDDYVQSFLENNCIKNSSEESRQNDVILAVYEKMLKASVSETDKFIEIQSVIKNIGTETLESEGKTIIPIEFIEMYKVFCDYLGIK